MKVLSEIGMKIAKLVDVKSIITLLLTIAFIRLAFQYAVTTEFLSIYTMIIGFYFGTQSKKNEIEQK